MYPKIIFILNSLSQPRSIRRVLAFDRADYDIMVYGFDRNNYNLNVLPPHIPIVNLGSLENGQGYFKRLLFYRNTLRSILKKHNKENVIYYLEGMDIAFFTRLFTHKKYIYEIADIRYSFLKNKFVQYVFKTVDIFLIKKSLLTVLITGGFIELFDKKKRLDNIIIQPNRMSNYFMTQPRRISMIPTIKSLRFAYVGFLGTHRDYIYDFADKIGKYYSQHSFTFYGDGVENKRIEKMSKDYKNVYYKGAFKNPEDLQKIYEQVDILVACYDPKVFNQKVAEPNKFYEALFFGKPIIVSKGTYLEKKIKEWKCGYIIDVNKENEVLGLIDSFKLEILHEIQKNIEKIPLSYIVDDDAKRIINYLRGFVN